MVAAYALAYSYPALAQTLNDPKLHVREVTSGLSQPTAMAFIGPSDILVLQKGDGRVRRVINGMLQPGIVLDVAVDSASERGLLGIAIHPSFPLPCLFIFIIQRALLAIARVLLWQIEFIAIYGMGVLWSVRV
jgi:glucose/arabinose dehydrogenase